MTTAAPTQHQFPCKQCGALLTFSPGTNTLQCPYCHATNTIAVSDAPIQELDYEAALHEMAGSAETIEMSHVKCESCGAESNLPPNTASGLCPFCGQPIVAIAGCKRLIKPKSLLPFKIKREEAGSAFGQWLSGLWFAPSGLVKLAEKGRIDGCYIPAWTYDCQTTTRYSGERGEDYWETETYTEMVDGKAETRTRQVMKTRWWPASGTVENPFDDVLVLASNSLPPKARDHLEPWDLPALVPYQDDYLSGFVTEMYQIDLPQGFDLAKGRMQPVIENTIQRDIGGDHQRIDSSQTDYRDIRFKHILLPLWISAYRLRDKSYRFLVNARTGAVAGERPYSAWKIMAAIVTAILVITIIALIASQR